MGKQKHSKLEISSADLSLKFDLFFDPSLLYSVLAQLPALNTLIATIVKIK